MQRHLHHHLPKQSVLSGMEAAQNSKTDILNPFALRSSIANWLFSLIVIFIVGTALSSVASGQMTMDVDHEMDVARASQGSNAPDYTTVFCGKSGQQPLPVGDYNSDLHVVGPCVADGTLGGGIYKYHWVFIHNGGTLTFNDDKLDLYASSILVLNGGTLKAGGPSETTAIGANGGLVTIHLWGGKNDAAIPCQKFDESTMKYLEDVTCGVDPTIWTSNKKGSIYPTSCKPNSQDPRGDCFYQYDDPSVSTLYFGRKTLAVSYGGTLQLFGKKGSTFDGLTPVASNTGKSWRRLATNLASNGDTFDVDGAVDWQENDHIVITPTDYLPGHAEEAIIGSVTPNGATTTIKITGIVLDDGTVKSGGVQYPHWGTTYKIPDAMKTKLNLDRSEVETRAAVALLSRDIRIVSEGDTAPADPSPSDDPSFPPTPGNYFGGHVIFRQGFKQVQVQGVEFRQLGQGGIIGRYAVHFHMARKVPLDTFLKDNSINESMTRWITIHGTEGVLEARNVGWKSIGHGFYIEDGTETDNKLYANIGILARGAVANSENPRKVPGILANPDLGEIRSPFNSDWQHPSVFWIMNGWNEFKYNMAAGAGTCGMCYWLTAGANSGPSRYEYWTGYASRQNGLREGPGQRDFNAGTSPLQTFVGNSCSTAMFSFMEIGNPDFTCLGFGRPTPITVAAIPGLGPQVGQGSLYDYYPITSGLRDPTKCNTLNGDCYKDSDQSNRKCGGTDTATETNCMATVLDHYTTSFNFSEKNFSSIWMRQWWKLVTDSAITDQLGPGLTYVTGGSYTRADNSVGDWDVALRDVMVGQTQPDPNDENQQFFASDLGPFTPNGIRQCDNGQIPGGYCLSRDNGISMLITPFNAGQRMFNIYDGPSFQDSNGYLDIKAKTIPDCTPAGRDSGTGVCNDSKYMYGHSVGLLQSPDKKSCYMPNAAIAWKQENGFYYPPAFHSKNLAFSNVDIRHFVIEPLFKPYTIFQFDEAATAARYCTWTNTLFEPFNDIDRQTVLNDDDGSLTGLLAAAKPARETLSVNEDVFFRAPKVTPECASDRHYKDPKDLTGKPATAITSPYQYATTAIFPDCIGTGAETSSECGFGTDGKKNWTREGTHVYGVPMFRQNWTAQDNTDCDSDILCKTDPIHRPGRLTMMGQGNGQRSILTANQAWYYIDTTVPADKQVGVPQQNGRSVFLSGHTYYVYLVYGASSTQAEYWMYVGSGADEKTVLDAVGRYRVNINSGAFVFTKNTGADFLTSAQYDPVSGWLKIKVNLQAYDAEFVVERKNFCKPVSYCTWKGNSCGCAAGSDCKDDSVCSWGPHDIDCPTKGCFGFSFKIQPQFDMNPKPAPPQPAAFPSDSYWNVAYKLVDSGISGAECHYGDQPK